MEDGMQTRTKISLPVMALAAGLLWSNLASASALDQFKLFVSSTQSAKGEFVQRLVKVESGTVKISYTYSGTFVFARPGKFIWTYL